MKYLFITLIFLFFFSCKEEEKKPYKPIFISSKYLVEAKKIHIDGKMFQSIYGRSYLMETSQDFLSDSVKKEAEQFFKQNCDICSIPDSINYYSFTIREKTECTEQFLYRKSRDGDGCWENEETKEFSYFIPLSRMYKRDSINKDKWTYYYKNDKVGRDSIIICEKGEIVNFQ